MGITTTEAPTSRKAAGAATRYRPRVMTGVVRWWAGRQVWAPRWLSRLVALLGAVGVGSALFPALRSRLEVVVELFPQFVPTIATAGTLAVGLVLIGLARGLRRRKRGAWTAAVVLSAISAVLHLVKGLDVEETVFATGVLVALLATTQCFPAAADPLTRRGLVTMLLAVPISGVLFGTIYLALRPHQLVGPPPWHSLVVEAAAGLVGVDGPVAYRSTAVADRTAVLLGVLGLACLLTLLVMLLRPGRAPAPPGPQDTRRLRELVERFGAQDSLGYFALRDDRLCVFSPTGKSAVTYRVLDGVSLAAGDSMHSNLVTKRFSTSPTSPCRAGRCAVSGRRSTGSRAPGRPPGRTGWRTSRQPSLTRCAAGPTSGATGRPNAGSRWRSAASATQPTASACWFGRTTRMVRCAGCCTWCRGDPTGCRWT
jgi:hypothetical protein